MSEGDASHKSDTQRIGLVADPERSDAMSLRII